MELNVIYARARNGVIGLNGAMPWHIGEDLAHFRSMTLGNVVIMGRKTYQSLPGPLSGRINVVVSRSQVAVRPEANTYRAASFKEALAIAERVIAMKAGREIWVIGGAEIYKQALPLATRVEVTEIDAEFKGDIHMPKLGREWRAVEKRKQSTAAGIDLTFITYERNTSLLQRARTAMPMAGKGIVWALFVAGIAYAPALMAHLYPETLNVTTSIFMGLAVLGAMSVVDMLVRFGNFTLAHFFKRNHKE